MSDTRQLSTYQLLPTVYRLRDGQRGGTLESLLQVIDEQVHYVLDNVREMYDDWFIETCRSEFVPYIGELLGGHVSANLLNNESANGYRQALRLVNPRREVSDAISLQRRKGTLPVLEELSQIVSNWYAHAEEWYPRVAQFQDTRRLMQLNNLSLDPATKQEASAMGRTLLSFGQTVDVRKLIRNGSLDGPFDQGSYFTDTKPVRPGFAPKSRDLIRLHVWRLKPYRITQGRPKCIRAIDIKCGDKKLKVFALDSVGLCRPLHVNPNPEVAETDISMEQNLPVPLTRELLAGAKSSQPGESNDDNSLLSPSPRFGGEGLGVRGSAVSETYYGRGKSLELWLEHFDTNIWKRDFIPAKHVQVCDLSSVLCCCKDSGCECANSNPDQKKTLFDQLNLTTIEDYVRWQNSPEKSSSATETLVVAIDPECGLAVVLYDHDAKECGPSIFATYHNAFSADMGGGEYYRDRALTLDQPRSYQRVRRLPNKCKDREVLDSYFAPSPANDACDKSCCHPTNHRLIEIADSDTYKITGKTIKVAQQETLEIRAAKNRFPTIELDCDGCNPALIFELEPGARLILDGLRIVGGRVLFKAVESEQQKTRNDSKVCECHIDPCNCRPVADPTCRIFIRHCTLVPLAATCAACCHWIRPAEIENTIPGSILTIDHSIVPTIRQSTQANAPDELPRTQRLLIVDSIVDSQGGDQCAICGTYSTILRVERSTIIGDTTVREVDLAQDSIFTCPVSVQRRQPGGMRFCYVPQNNRSQNDLPPDWHTPRQFYCVPSQAYERANLVEKTCSLTGERVSEKDGWWKTIHPSFTSCSYGDPGYGQLRILDAADRSPNDETCDCKPDHLAPQFRCCRTDDLCSKEIVHGAECGSEMGAFHDLFQPQREDNLKRRIDEFTPITMHTELRFIN